MHLIKNPVVTSASHSDQFLTDAFIQPRIKMLIQIKTSHFLLLVPLCKIFNQISY